MTRPTTSKPLAQRVNYEHHGSGYHTLRQEEPSILDAVHGALGPAATVLNIGAGTGSYEPQDRYVAAVEPAEVMRRQRHGRAPAIHGVAEALPFDDGSFDAAMALLTIHHWTDPSKGLLEARRVARDSFVALTVDPVVFQSSWLISAYLTEFKNDPAGEISSPEFISGHFPAARTTPIPIPRQCRDGFTASYFNRPEAFLSPEIRQGQSIWHRMDSERIQRFSQELANDLESGAWDQQFGAYRDMASWDGGLRLVVADT